MRLMAIPFLGLLIGTQGMAAEPTAKKPKKHHAAVKTAPVETPAAAPTAPPAAAEPAVVKEQRCNVDVTIDNVRKSGDQYRGQICYTVFKGKDGFPDKSHLAHANHCVPVQQSPTVTFTLKELPCHHDYGIALLHDENMNRQLDKNLAIPKEGIGMSNNPSFIRVNAPSFDEVKFNVHDPQSAQKIHIHYF